MTEETVRKDYLFVKRNSGGFSKLTRTRQIKNSNIAIVGKNPTHGSKDQSRHLKPTNHETETGMLLSQGVILLIEINKLTKKKETQLKWRASNR